MVGYCGDYHLWIPNKEKVIKSRNINFDETIKEFMEHVTTAIEIDKLVKTKYGINSQDRDVMFLGTGKEIQEFQDWWKQQNYRIR